MPASKIRTGFSIIADISGLSFRIRSLSRDWFTVQFLRRIGKHMFNKENNGDYNRLDKVLAKMQEENKEG